MNNSRLTATLLGVVLILPGLALALHASAILPLAWEEQPVSGWHRVAGNQFAAPLHTMWMSRREVGESPTAVLEDGVALACPNTAEEVIAEKGSGRFLIADGFVYLAPSDNSDPATNGKNYAIRWPMKVPGVVMWITLLAASCGLGWLLLSWRSTVAAAIAAPPLPLCLLVVAVPFLFHRAWFFIDVPLPDIQYDTMSYYAVARDVLAGRWPHFEVRPPGYPLMLAATLGSLRGLLSITVLQTLATLTSAMVVVYAAYRLQRSLALWTALAMAIHVTSFWTIQFDTAILSESLYASALMLGVAFVMLSFASSRTGWFVAASFAMAAAILIRPAGLFLVGIVVVTLAYLGWNRRGWRPVTAFAVPFVVLMMATSIYNQRMARAFAPTAWAEANLLGVTSRLWEPDPSYPPEINRAVGDIQRIVGMSAEERATIDHSWSPSRLAPIFLKGYSEPALAIANSMGGDYVGSRPWMRRISVATLRRRPGVYARFVSTMGYLFFIDNIRWRADFADYVKVRALHILTEAAGTERRSRPAEDELVATYLDRSRITGIGVNDACIGPDAVGRLAATPALRVHRLSQRARDLVAARTLWVAAYLAVMALAVYQLLRSRGQRDAAFLVVVLGLYPIGAGIVVCLVEYGAARYSYPTEFVYYLVVAMAPLLSRGHG